MTCGRTPSRRGCLTPAAGADLLRLGLGLFRVAGRFLRVALGFPARPADGLFFRAALVFLV